jgi:surfactin synthase thioesterase subunit
MHTSKPRWLLCRTRRPAAALRLYCFPHSGGSPGEYLRWADALPPQIELWGVQPPGRGSRSGEKPFTDMAALVDAFVSEADLVAPYAFFGHSLGAAVAYETARAARRSTGGGPVHLVVSGYPAPHVPRSPLPLDVVTGPGLLAAVEQRYGPVPPEIRDDPATLDMYLDGLRADMCIVATYAHLPGTPLSCPLTVLGGTDDAETPDGLSAWRAYTTGRFTQRMFPGGHFYFRADPAPVLEFLGRLLTPA